MATTRLRVMLVDDHAVVRDGLKTLIDAQDDLEVVGEASDGRAACDAARALRPDVVIMDVSMPGMAGDLATAELTRACPGVKVLALTVHEDRAHLRRLLRAGAAGYVVKLATGDEFLRAIRAVAAGGTYLDPIVAGSLVEIVREPRRGHAGAADVLTDREAEVLRKVAEGYSNKEIAAQLDISVKTVETHKLRAGEKLGLRSRADVVQFALREGWLSPS